VTTSDQWNVQPRGGAGVPPAVVALAVALIAGAMFAALSWFVLGHTWDVLEYDQPLVVYNTPVGMVLVLWLFDVTFRATTPLQRVVAGVVIIAALLRSRIAHPVIHLEPPWSGHALFLAFALVTARATWVRVACVVALAQVVMLKVRFDDHSWIVGVALGIAAGALFVRMRTWRA
jgi:hypothetical protein